MTNMSIICNSISAARLSTPTRQQRMLCGMSCLYYRHTARDSVPRLHAHTSPAGAPCTQTPYTIHIHTSASHTCTHMHGAFWRHMPRRCVVLSGCKCVRAPKGKQNVITDICLCCRPATIFLGWAIAAASSTPPTCRHTNRVRRPSPDASH